MYDSFLSIIHNYIFSKKFFSHLPESCQLDFLCIISSCYEIFWCRKNFVYVANMLRLKIDE